MPINKGHLFSTLSGDRPLRRTLPPCHTSLGQRCIIFQSFEMATSVTGPYMCGDTGTMVCCIWIEIETSLPDLACSRPWILEAPSPADSLAFAPSGTERNPIFLLSLAQFLLARASSCQLTRQNSSLWISTSSYPPGFGLHSQHRRRREGV